MKIIISRLDSKGAALSFVLLTMMILALVGSIILSTTSLNLNHSGITNDNYIAYYVAEAGSSKMIHDTRMKVVELFGSNLSVDEFFSELENFMDDVFIVEDFSDNLGRQLNSETIVLGKRLAGSDTAEYTLVTTGEVDGMSKTINSVISITYASSSDGVPIDDLFIIGPTINYGGTSINGVDGMVYFDGLNTHNLNGGTAINVSNMFFNGDVIMDGGSASLGSQASPGTVFIKGNLDLWTGTRNVYGEYHVDGNFRLKDARMHGDVYVNGNVELGWTPQINGNIYYTGNLIRPNNYSAHLLLKCIKVDTVPSFDIPPITVSIKTEHWYEQNGYMIRGNVTENVIPSNSKMLVDNYTSNHHTSPSGDVVIVSKGNINISGWRNIRGLLIAPYGTVTLNVASFSGIIISKGNVISTQGGSTITMVSLSEFFPDGKYPYEANGGTSNGGGVPSLEEAFKILVKSIQAKN